MATVKMSDMEQLTGLYGRRMDFVVKQSTNDAFVMSSNIAVGVTRGGTVRRGFIPRADGTLAASGISELSGSTFLTQGDGAFNLVVGNMQAGDKASFGWTAPYALRAHYEYGWHWVTETANSWPSIVNSNAAKARAMQR